jgi:ketosteroid isomerase-like protein
LESASASALAQKALILRWANAFNARNLDDLLACLHAGVELHPLKLVGIESAYHGHDGVRAWFERLEEQRYAHRIELSRIRDGRDGDLLATGALHVAGHGPVAPFYARHRVDNGLIAVARHYPQEPDLVERVKFVSRVATT